MLELFCVCLQLDSEVGKAKEEEKSSYNYTTRPWRVIISVSPLVVIICGNSSFPAEGFCDYCWQIRTNMRHDKLSSSLGKFLVVFKFMTRNINQNISLPPPLYIYHTPVCMSHDYISDFMNVPSHIMMTSKWRWYVCFYYYFYYLANRRSLRVSARIRLHSRYTAVEHKSISINVILGREVVLLNGRMEMYQ